jgi:hypothetical protein
LIKNPGIGIVGMTLNKKEIIAINSIYDHTFFKNLIDLETGFPLVTFLLFNFKNEKIIIAICQVPHKTGFDSNKPKDMDIDVIQFFSQLSSFWLSNFFSVQSNV